MPSFLFDTGPRPRSLERGTFDCPHCGAARPFARVLIERTMKVPGLRLVVGSYGEYIECHECLSTYRPDVLACDAGADAERVLGEYQRALKRVLALLIVTDGRIQEPEIAMMQRIFEEVCGIALAEAEVRAEAEAVAAEPMTAARYLAQVVGHMNEHGKEQVLRGAALVSLADGSLHEREADMVRRLGAVMRLPPDRIEALLRVVV